MSCLEAAAETSFLEQPDGNVLGRAGLTAQVIFNQTTLETNQEEKLSDPETSKFILNAGVREKLSKTLQTDTLSSAFQTRARDCFPNEEGATGTEQPTEYFYSALHLEAAGLAKLVVQFGGTVIDCNTHNCTGPPPDDYTPYFQGCLGLGADIDIHGTVALGVLSSSDSSDLAGGALMVDADLSVFAHLIGGAVGLTIPSFRLRAEWSRIGPFGGLGLGGGVGAYGCFPLPQC